MSTYIIFDLDETLGHFTQLGILWESIQHVYKKNLNQSYFNCICDLYPHFLRPSILTILRYLKNVKKKNKNLKIIVYTNNQGPKSWCNYIINYLENKIKYKLFDQIVYAYKINGRQIELNRTTHNKTYTDIKNCIQCLSYDKICFIDDQFHPGMKNNNIYYINVKPYIYNYELQDLYDIFTESTCNELICNNLHIVDREKFHNNIKNYMNTYNFTSKNMIESELKLDKTISKKILYHLHKFMKLYLKKPNHKKSLKKNNKNNNKINNKSDKNTNHKKTKKNIHEYEYEYEPEFE
jgi:hypothetical protein